MTAARVAAAPISRGVREVPGWVYQLPRERVLAEMKEVRMTATEFGPNGIVPKTRDCAQVFRNHVAKLGRYVRNNPRLLSIAKRDKT
jgi:hypothetical protein